MTESAPECAFPQTFRLHDQDFEGPDFSRVVLFVLRRLDSDFPSRIDLTTCQRITDHKDGFDRLWTWISHQGLVSGPPSNCALTLSGHQSFSAGLENAPKLASKLMSEAPHLEGDDATRLLLGILRHHFENFPPRDRG